jgi:hypothetical protein
MPFERFQIHQAEHLWGNCLDARPWLIVDIRPNGIFGCFPIASEDYGGDTFYIDSTHADFSATGLTKSCHVHWVHIIELERSQFRKQRGALTGDLLASFRDASGL